jgi:hypothetical protein
VLFYSIKSGNYYYFTRCSQVEVEIKQPKYQKMFRTSNLVIYYHRPPFYLFLLVKDENLSSKSFLLDHFSTSRVSIGLKIIKKEIVKPTNCKDYRRAKECSNRAHCINQCVHKLSIRRNLNISSQFVKDKDYFSKDEWKKLFINYLGTNLKLYENLVGECEKRFIKKIVMKSILQVRNLNSNIQNRKLE